jgi:hypothetical protein
VNNIIEENHHSMMNDFNINGSSREGNFVTSTQTSHRETHFQTDQCPFSCVISERMKTCIHKISKSLEVANMPKLASQDILNSLAELESIRLDFESKYEVSVRK